MSRRTGRAGGGHGGGHLEFGNEALMASGLGSGSLRFGMSGAAAGGLAVGAGVAAVGGSIAAATGRAVAFEHAMTEVGKAIGETAGGMRGLESQFLELARKSGIAKTEIAGIAAQGGYFNVPREQLPGFVDIATRAAVGFQMRPDEAGEAFGPLMKSYKLGGNDDLRLAGDAINTVGDSVGVRERNILNYLNRTSGVAGMLRIPLAQNAAIGGAIQSLGVAPDVAATSFDQVARRLANANLHRDPEFSRGLRGIGMSGRQVKAAMDQDGLAGFMTVLEKLKALKQEKRSNVIEELFGEGEVANVSRMVESLDTLKAALEMVRDPEKYRGSLDRTFKIFSSDTTASINRAGAALDGFATRFGQRFNPAVKASADLMARWLGGMTKVLELEDRTRALSGKQLKGEALTPKERAELDANPRLKAETDRRVGIGREDAGRRAIVEEEGRARARAAPKAAPGPAGPAPPREPDEQDAAAAEARERTRTRLEGQIRDLDAEVEARRSGGYETTADRLRLRKLRQQYERQFPDAAEKPDAKPDALPGTGRRSDLRDGVKASLASYHEEVEQSLTRTERVVRDIAKRMTGELEIRPKVQDAAFRFGAGDGSARVERAALGGGGVDGGLGAGGGLGSGGGGLRRMPGRFGGAIPEPRGGASRFGGGGSRRFEGGPTGIEPGGGGHKAPSTAEGKDNVASWLAFAQRPVDEGGLGLTKEQAHGLVAGLQGESGANLDPGAWNGNDRGMPSGGTAQWRAERLRNLQAFAREQGKDWRDRGVQQQFFRHEMLGSGAHGGGRERRAYEAIRGARTRQDALREHVEKFERPQYPGAETRKRSQYLYGHEGGTADGSTGKAAPGAGQPGANGEYDPLGGAPRRYSSGFGMRDHPIHGGHRMHYGQDMAAPAGSPVNAMQGGRVTAISRMGDVTITHPDGSTKTYRHIDPSGIKLGQEVEGGAPIGTLRARDPRATGPHLHLEATDAQGRKYDPRAEIDGANRAGTDAVAGGPEQEMAERAPAPGEPRQLRPWSRRPEAAAPRSPRFMDPGSYQLKPGVAADTAGGGAAGRGATFSGPPAVQNFYGGFDEQGVARRAQLEQNREVRRTMAGALHDGSRPT